MEARAKYATSRVEEAASQNGGVWKACNRVCVPDEAEELQMRILIVAVPEATVGPSRLRVL